MFNGSTDPEESLEWIDMARGVLIHMACLAEMWIRVVTGANVAIGQDLVGLGLVLSLFACATLAEAVMRTLECVHAHESYHQARGTG